MDKNKHDKFEEYEEEPRYPRFFMGGKDPMALQEFDNVQRGAWLTNATSEGVARMSMNDKMFGDPQPAPGSAYSVQELKDMGYIGIYWQPGKER